MKCRMFLVVALSSLMLASCAGSGITEGSDPPAAIASSTTTVVPATSTTVPDGVGHDGVPFPAGESVDLVVLTDSSGFGLADRYAKLAAEALGREIRVHDEAVGGTPITDILEWVQTSLADKVAEAEIIVVYGFPGPLESEMPEPYVENCFEASDAVLVPDEYSGEWVPGMVWEPTPKVAAVEEWWPYRDVLNQVYAEIWKLREGQPTIIRTYDTPLGFLGPWKQLGIESECMANWEILSQVIREAAEASGAGFVSTIDVFNGPDHDEDPVEKGWMKDDLMHANDEGRDIIAELLAAYGFEISQPPG